MDYIVYLSSASQWFNETELLKILTISRENNTTNGISGILLYGNGMFLQVLEGEKEQLTATFNRIAEDERHKGITEVASGPLAQRNFADWGMAFKAVGKDTFKQIKGFLDPLSPELLSNKDGHIAINLIKAFIKKEKMIF